MPLVWDRLQYDDSVPLVDRYRFTENPPTIAKRHPNYVYSVSKNACLMHKVDHVELYWYAYVKGGRKVARLKTPGSVAITVCGVSKFLRAEKTRTCTIPLPDSILCGRCHGEVPTFGKFGSATKLGLTRKEAAVKLGCKVAGYPSALKREDLEK